MIRLCIHLKYYSTAAYEILRNVIKLPSTRTLRDYTNYIEAKPGEAALILLYMLPIDYYIIQKILWQSANLLITGLQPQLLAEVAGIFGITEHTEDWQRYVILSFDEMKIKENIVYNANTGECVYNCVIQPIHTMYVHNIIHIGQFIGFTKLGDINTEIEALASRKSEDAAVATYMLAFMVRSVFGNKEYTVAHYPTRGARSTMLFPIVWSVVRALEGFGFKVNYLLELACTVQL